MLKRWVFSLVVLILLSPLDGQGRQLSGWLRSPGVRWENQRLHGEVKNVPIARLIEDLLRDERFECSASGALPGTISMRFDGLTVEESIRRIMRSNHYSFTLILHPVSGETAADAHQVRELRVYQGSEVVRFAKTQRPTAPRPEGVPSAALPAAASRPATAVGTGEPLTDAAWFDRQQLDREIKVWMDEMLSQQKITREEYDRAVDEMGLLTNKEKEKRHEKENDR